MISDEAKRSLVQIIRRTFDEWMATAETVEAWASLLERAIAGQGAPQSATVEEIAGIIQRGYNNWTDAESIAREIAARIPAPAVPAEIGLDTGRRLNNLFAANFDDKPEWFIEGLVVQTIKIVREELRSQRARDPASYPEAVELAKRLPSPNALDNYIERGGNYRLGYFDDERRQALADAAAFVRRKAGETA